MLLRLTTLGGLGGRALAIGASAGVHAALLLTWIGHPGAASPATLEGTSIEIQVDPVPLVDEPDPAAVAKNMAVLDHSHAWPTHTHPYPVPPSHDWTPHDPNLVHVFSPASPASTAAPAEANDPAPPVETASDETPRFTIAVGPGSDDARGSGSAPGGDAHDHGLDAPAVPEASVDSRASLVHGHPPAYPDDARAEGIEGDVRLSLIVGPTGGVESATVVRGLGHGLDAAALHAASTFIFAPAMLAGHPVRVRMGWAVQFRLR